MHWKVRDHTLDLSSRTLVMGVLNVTPDSFSDGGLWLDPDAAVERGMAMAAMGATILDVGGESSRPGAEPVSSEEELRRVLPVVEALSKRSTALISIDTTKPAVALEAVRRGASIVNDITGLQNPEMLEVLRQTGAGAVAMHMKGTPTTMQQAPVYEDVVREVRAFLEESLLRCEKAGIKRERLALDPGIGFGKTLEHNLRLLRELKSLHALGRPLVLGVSRKSFLSAVSGCTSVEERLWPTVALSSFAMNQGVSVVRVHDVAPNVEALRASRAILEACA
jgi:dihydropteroate synthase